MKKLPSLVLLLLVCPSLAQMPGSLDVSFGVNGIVLTTINYSSSPNALAIQPDGKIVIVGTTILSQNNNNSAFFCTRYNADGSLDTTFGVLGVVQTDITNNTVNTDEATAVAIQNDGKIIVGGYHNDGIALVRYHPNGTPDTSFGTSGLATFNDYSKLNVIKVDPTGNIIAGGSVGGFPGNAKLYRFTPNGFLDTTFNAGGSAVIHMIYAGGSGLTAEIHDLDMHANGTITAVGKGYHFVGVGIVLHDWVCRVMGHGSMDNSFSADGINAYQYPTGYSESDSKSLILNPDGSIIAGGLVNRSGSRYLKAFEIGNDGTAVANQRIDVDFGSSARGGVIRKDTHGKYIIAGTSSNKIALTAANSNFAIDTNFGTNGKVNAVSIGGSEIDMAIQSDNKIVVAATMGLNILLARFHGSDDGLATDQFQAGQAVVYPNPCDQHILLKRNETDNQDFYICDTNGRVVSNGILTGQETQIDIAPLESGLYFLTTATLKPMKLIKK